MNRRNNVSRRNFLGNSSALLAVGGMSMLNAQEPEKPMALDQHAKHRTDGPLFVSFSAGSSGTWKIDSIHAVKGEGLSIADRLTVIESLELQPADYGVWTLRGVTSNVRYSARSEVTAMRSKQEGLGRSQATRAALIPIRKTDAWWSLAQDERRAIFEEQSHHIAIGVEYLPAVARRLHHGRELGEPFDFLTWFEYAPQDSPAFESLVNRLRATKEWAYVDREVDIRLSRS